MTSLHVYFVDLVYNARQVLEDCPGDLSLWYRHISKGAWPFSTADHGWPISDCTSEGLKVKPNSLQIYHVIHDFDLFKRNWGCCLGCSSTLSPAC